MTIHELKTWQPHYGEVAAGIKTFEVRKADRDFKVGDLLHLREWCPETSEYSGQTCLRCITHLMSGGQFGVEPGYVTLSLSSHWRGQHADS
jgi:hypothetical protein